MHELVENVLATRLVPDADGLLIKAHSFIPRDECELIYRTILDTQATRAVEVGMAYGVASLCICDALCQSAKAAGVGQPSLTSMDPDQNQGWRGIGLSQLRRAGFAPLVEFHESTSQATLPALMAAGRRFDFGFIDGWHTFDHTLIDFFYIDMMLEVGGAIVFDDVGYSAINSVVRFVLSNRDYELVEALVQYPVKMNPVKAAIKKFGQRIGRTDRSARPSDKPIFDRLLGKHSVSVRKRGHDARNFNHFVPFP